MNDSLKVLTFGAVALCILGCASPGRAEGGGGLEAVGSTGQIAALAPSFAAVLPYDGYGSVAILDDGILLITVGGETRGDDRDPADSATYEGQLDTAGLNLVEHGDEIFLDQGGAQMAARGLAPGQVTTHAFVDARELDAQTPRYAVIDLQGDLRVAYDPITGDLAVAIAETAEPGRKLRFTVRVAGRPEGGGDGQAPAGVLCSPGDGLEPADIPVWLDGPGTPSSTCSMSCKNGECSITCNSSGCRAYCSAGNPVCVCTNQIQE